MNDKTTLVELNVSQISTILYCLDKTFKEYKNFDGDDLEDIEEVFALMQEASDTIPMD